MNYDQKQDLEKIEPEQNNELGITESPKIDMMPPENLTEKPSKNKSIKELLYSIIGIVIIIALSIVIIFSLDGPKKSEDQKNTETTNVPTQSAKYKYLYATKTGKTVKVMSIDQDNKSEVLFTNQESYDYSEIEGNYYQSLPASVSISHDQTKIAFIKDNDLMVYDLSDKSTKTIIDTSTEATDAQKADPNFSDINLLRLNFNTPVDAKRFNSILGIFGLFSPEWSLDDSVLGFGLGHYEGGSYTAINLKDNKFLDLTETFHYIDMEPIPDNYPINKANVALVQNGIGLPYYFKFGTDDILYPQVSSDKKAIFAQFCQKDLASTGSSQFLSENAKDYAGRRDCQEAMTDTNYPEILKIDVETGKYTSIAKSFVAPFAIKDNQLTYMKDSQTVSTTDLTDTTKKSKDIDIIQQFKIDKTAYKATILSQNKPGFATIISDESTKKYASFVDINQPSHAIKVEIPEKTGLELLSVIEN